MSDPEIARVELELARGVEPIEGHIRLVDAAPRPFVGVLELINLLDEARAATATHSEISRKRNRPTASHNRLRP